MATNSFDDNAPSLSTSIPSENHSNAHLTDTDFNLTAPAAPEDGAPENLEGGRPVYPDNTSSGSNIVLWPPASSRPTPSIPSFPTCPFRPNCSNSMSQFGLVRFLNASANTFAVNIEVDQNAFAINSRFGTVSNYEPVSDGFHTITVRRASGISNILLQRSFPFSAEQRYTVVLTDNASGGLDMIQVRPPAATLSITILAATGLPICLTAAPATM